MLIHLNEHDVPSDKSITVLELMFLPLAYFITPCVHMVFSLFMYWNIISHVPRKMHACSLNKHCVPPSEQALHVFTYMNSVGTVREQITFFQWECRVIMHVCTRCNEIPMLWHPLPTPRAVGPHDHH